MEVDEQEEVEEEGGGVDSTREVEVVDGEGAVDALLGHQHQVRRVRLRDALPDVPGGGRRRRREERRKEEKEVRRRMEEEEAVLPLLFA